MAITHTIQQGWQGNSNTPSLYTSQAIVGGREANCDEATPNSTTTGVVIAIPTSTLLSLYIVSTVNTTLKTNSSGSPDQTFTLAGGVPFVWVGGSGVTNPITTAVTELFSDVGGTVDGVLSVRSLAS